MFKRYNFVAAPVIDESQRLVGVMTIDDIVDILDEEADEEIKALGGVKGDEELSDTVPAIARSKTTACKTLICGMPHSLHLNAASHAQQSPVTMWQANIILDQEGILIASISVLASRRANTPSTL